MRLARQWCAVSVVAGVMLFLWGMRDAMAQSPGGDAPTYATWFTILLGALMALLGAYFRGALGTVKERISENKTEIASLTGRITATQRALDREYHNKQETNAMFTEIKASISALHRRLDLVNVPSLPPERRRGWSPPDDGA